MPHSIIVIDDNNEILNLTRYSLAHLEDVSLQTFANPVTALKKIETSGAPDLIITDLKMASMNGIELLARLSIIAPAMQVIVFTGHVESLPPGSHWHTVFKDAHGFDRLVEKVEELLFPQPVQQDA